MSRPVHANAIDSFNIRHWCWWMLHCFPPFVGEGWLYGCSSATILRHTVQLRLATRPSVCSRNACVVGKFYHSVSWCYRFQVCRFYNIGCSPNTGSMDNQQSAMQMNRCRHLVPLYPYHAT